MKKHFKKQVEVQGIKKLDSIKGVQTLDAKELREIDGGWLGAAVVGALIGMALTQDLDSLVDSFKEGYNRARN